MTKITLLKQHLGLAAGTDTETEDGIAAYLIRMGVAKAYTEKKEKVNTKEKVEHKNTPKKNK